MSKEFQAVVDTARRVTIPRWVREDLDIDAGDVVVLEVKKVIKRAKRG